MNRLSNRLLTIGILLFAISASCFAAKNQSPTATVTVSPALTTLYSRGTQQFTATVTSTSTNKSVSWSASAGTINNTGFFTAPSVTTTKTVTVKATSKANSAASATATVTVLPLPPASIVVSPATASIQVGTTKQYTAVARNKSGTRLTGITFSFYSDNYAVAMIDSGSGIATGESAGVAYITASAQGVTSAPATLTVTVPPPPPPAALKRLSPFMGRVGSGDFDSLTIVGTGFVVGATVNFGATVLTPSSVTPTSIKVLVPLAEFTAARVVQVSVTNPGQSPTTALPFTITDAGFVSITFDDGYQSVYDYARPILDAAGIRGTFYVITGAVGDTVDGYMTLPEITAMSNNGHEIGNHTRTHPFLSTVSPTQLVSETSGAQQDFASWKLYPTTFAYPYDDHGDGYTGNPVEEAVRAAGFRGARITESWEFNTPNVNPFFLFGYPIEPDMGTDNMATIAADINIAVANKVWVILIFHRVDDPLIENASINVPHQLIQGMANYLTQNGVPVVTVGEGLVIENLDGQK